MASVTLKDVTIYFDRVVGKSSGYRENVNGEEITAPDMFYFHLRITNNRGTSVTISSLHSNILFYERGNTRYSSKIFTIPAGTQEMPIEVYYSGYAEHYLLNNELQAWLKFSELPFDEFTAKFNRYEGPDWEPPNTGYKAWAQLEEYYLDNGAATGNTKPNDPADPDYVAPVYDLNSCPLP